MPWFITLGGGFPGLFTAAIAPGRAKSWPLDGSLPGLAIERKDPKAKNRLASRKYRIGQEWSEWTHYQLSYDEYWAHNRAHRI